MTRPVYRRNSRRRMPPFARVFQWSLAMPPTVRPRPGACRADTGYGLGGVSPETLRQQARPVHQPRHEPGRLPTRTTTSWRIPSA
jgi:hypothetical protein